MHAPTEVSMGIPQAAARDMRRYQCAACWHIYDPAEGDPASGIPAGTSFLDLPDDWRCPDCGASKADFDPLD
jgi:rubredoxin